MNLTAELLAADARVQALIDERVARMLAGNRLRWESARRSMGQRLRLDRILNTPQSPAASEGRGAYPAEVK